MTDIDNTDIINKFDEIKVINNDTFNELTGVTNNTLSNITTNVMDVKTNTHDILAFYNSCNELLTLQKIKRRSFIT